MSITLDWTDRLDELVTEAIKNGLVSGELSGKPDAVVESGLAHVFFYGDTVYKLYKTYADKDHFIKGVLAPTDRRRHFIAHDFTLNRHFSSDIYRNLHSVHYQDGKVIVGPFDDSTIYSLVEMIRLEFDHNLHERLLREEITHDEMYVLGYETARCVSTSPIKAPEDVNWYDLAYERVGFLAQFVDWLPEEYGKRLQEEAVIDALYTHLDAYKDEYQSLRGEALAVNMDNHDENVFFIDGKPQFIDLLPPMSCWWYGLPYANLSNLMINVEALYSLEAAAEIERGYFAYHDIDSLPEHSYGFTRAFAHLISIAHFGSVPEKREVTQKYIDRLPEVTAWL